jgi:TetR/AcrR family transcriptional regulator, tetracycline repressor protein
LATRPTTRRLTTEAIVDAASELAESRGFSAVTIRAVAKRCGVAPMTLYTYFATKEELLGEVADRFLAEVDYPDTRGMVWKDELTALFLSTYEVFTEHPELAQFLASQPHGTGRSAYRGAETVLAALKRAGLDDDDAVAALEALLSFVAGFSQRETSRQALHRPPAERLREVRNLPEEEFPTVRSLAHPLVTRDPRRSFEIGLELLLRGIGDATASAA